jgi:hypothetical protein
VIPIAIERPSGLLVDALVEAGFVVTPVHPNVVKACRPRYRAVAAKSDSDDAFILTDILRTDGHRLRAVRPSVVQKSAVLGSPDERGILARAESRIAPVLMLHGQALAA